MKAMDPRLSPAVLAALRAIADPERAPAMQAYMKSAMPYLGVAATPLQRVCKVLFADLHWPDTAAWQADVLTLWRNADYREQRYAAIALTGVRAASEFQTAAALPMYEEMVVSGGW
jgi:3-methyladenine DNA glycosylase AlkD